MLSQEQKKQFNEILEELGENLDISETQHKAIEKSYEAVGDWLSKEDSELAPYNPIISPQGSFRLGTLIKPINEKDDLDIDLVCELTGKKASWTQADLKKAVGDRLKAHDTYKKMLDKEGRRCWTLKYSEAANYHMDVLPSIVSNNYKVLLENAFSDIQQTDVSNLAIKITDTKLLPGYYIDTNPDKWLESNPFGYSRWFFNRATLDGVRLFSLNESVNPLPDFQSQKTPLQRVVQILKRHRDMMWFNRTDKDDKPISIIITTLATEAYNKESNVIEALTNIIPKMRTYIRDRNPITGAVEKWVVNPVNNKENFADKWKEYPARKDNFYDWLDNAENDIKNIVASSSRGVQSISETMKKSFGEAVVTRTFSNIGNRQRILTEQGNTRFDTKLGIVAGAVNAIKPHNFFGNED
jgi:hypothetical protein